MRKNKQSQPKKKKSKMLKNEQMGSGGCKPKKMVWKSKLHRPSPLHSFFNLQLQTFEKRAPLYKLLTPVFVIFCQNSKHETCRALNHDSNHIKNLI